MLSPFNTEIHLHKQPTHLYTSFIKYLYNFKNVNVKCDAISFKGMVDTIFADVAQPDQARIVGINALHFLKNQGHFVISIKVIKNINQLYSVDKDT